MPKDFRRASKSVFQTYDRLRKSAAYRGDKITKRVWQDIIFGEYIAQAIMSRGERVAGMPADLDMPKFGIRCYAYNPAIQWKAAGLYQGQTTNFLTPGGGCAPV